MPFCKGLLCKGKDGKGKVYQPAAFEGRRRYCRKCWPLRRPGAEKYLGMSPQEQDAFRRDLFRWADDVLVQAGYQMCGESDVHGLSRYYDRSGDGADAVRIRVSDHYAHDCRLDPGGRVQIDFGVRVDEFFSRRQIEKATREAIQGVERTRREQR